MKTIGKILFLSLITTVAVVALMLLISKFLIPDLGLRITYPLRVLRGTENYEGETRGVEMFFIWERFILPFIFLTYAVIFYLLRKRLRFLK